MPLHTPAADRLLAGAAQVDITPRWPAHLSGDVGAYRPARLVGDPLFARALVLETDGRRVCIVGLDVTIVTGDYTDWIRREAASRYGLKPEAVMVHAIQTHSAPSLGYFMLDPDFPDLPEEFEWVRGTEERYSRFAAERAVEAIGQAVGRLRPVSLGVASGIEGRWAHNRRAVMRDGTVGMPGPSWQGGAAGPTWIRYIEGPIDPELGVLCFRDDRLGMAGMLLSYTCHPVHVFPRLIVSADWPGAWAAALRRHHGDDCVPVVLNGCCGNINPWPPFDPAYVEDHVAMGRALADRAQALIDEMAFGEAAELDFRTRTIRLPIRALTDDERVFCDRVLGASPVPQWTDATRTRIDPDWMTAASLRSVDLLRQRDGALAYEIQVLRVGPVALVGLPGEPFVEGQLRLKLASPAYPTYVVHCTTQYVGYLPTREGLARGGHEAVTRYWAKLEPDALDLVVDAAIEVLAELFGATGT